MTAPFSTLNEFRAILASQPGIDTAAEAGAQERNGQLTKPPGALGRLEDLAIWYAGWRGNPRPAIEAPQVIIFAGNHGVCARGVSAFPAEVTVQMVANFKAGGAAINQLSKAFGAKMDVYALDLETPTQDFTADAAMTEADLDLYEELLEESDHDLYRWVSGQDHAPDRFAGLIAEIATGAVGIARPR